MTQMAEKNHSAPLPTHELSKAVYREEERLSSMPKGLISCTVDTTLQVEGLSTFGEGQNSASNGVEKER